MLLYFAHKAKRDAKYGLTKLAKMMFYADFLAFEHFGDSITGLHYKKLPQGPVPTQAKAIQEGLIAQGRAKRRTANFGREQLIPTERFNRKSFLQTFSEQELHLMDDVYEQIKPMLAVEVSDLTHEFIGWRVACDDEIIPYGTQLINRRPLTQRELEFAGKLIEDMGKGA